MDFLAVSWKSHFSLVLVLVFHVAFDVVFLSEIDLV